MIVKIDDGQIEAAPDLLKGLLADVRSQGSLFDEDAPRERLAGDDNSLVPYERTRYRL